MKRGNNSRGALVIPSEHRARPASFRRGRPPVSRRRIPMRRFLTILPAAIVALAVTFAPKAYAQSDQANLVDRARITIDDLKTDKEFGNARDLLRRAKAVLIVPSLVKGGFFVGGEGGQGVLLARNAAGWSNPAFYTLASASFGLQ